MSNIVVIGDCFIDRWITCLSTRTSAEVEGLPIYDAQSLREQNGGAANVFRAIQRLAPSGPIAVPMTLLGEHTIGERPVKTRLLVEGRQVCRFDLNDTCEPVAVNRIRDVVDHDSVVVVSDYLKGAIGDAQIQAIISQEPSIIWTNAKAIQPRHWHMDMARSRRAGPTVFRWTCNQAEYQKDQVFYDRQPWVVVTNGAKGITLYTEGQIVQEAKAWSKDAVSVCGAGDVVLAALVTFDDARWALEWSMAAAAVAVERQFTYCPTYSEVQERYER